MPVTVGLVGFGLAARVLHAPLILASGMSIAGVVSRQRDAVRDVLPSAEALPDLAALLAVPKLDVVVIATPNDLHEPQALAALAAGKLTVVDKPMALSVAGAERLMAAASDHRATLCTFHNRRWDSDFLTLHRIISERSLGELHTFTAQWNRYRSVDTGRWREQEQHGGGVLLDLGTHLIDQALVLFGMPDWIEAEVFRRRPGTAVADAFHLRLGRGALRIVLSASSSVADPGPRYVLHGSLGSFVKSGMDPQEEQLRAGMTPAAGEFGIEPETRWGKLTLGDTGNLRVLESEHGRWVDFYRAIRASVETGSAAPVPAQSARDVLRIIEAARESSARGARVMIQAGS